MNKDPLYIYPQDESYLPEEFHFSHNLAVKLYDHLVWILKDPKTVKKINVNIKFKEAHKNIELEEEEDVLDWLFKNGYSKEANSVITKHLTFALISDICHFIYQALDSARKHKVVVAFSLIRKPFLENLLILEQLLDNESHFLEKFKLDSNNFDPGKIKPDEKLKLIESCLSKIKTNYFLDAEHINDLRWNKQASESIYAHSNLATHLVTTRNKSYKTENQNLNFIFSNIDESESQLASFYLSINYLLYYLTEITDEYLLSKKILKENQYKERKFFRSIGYLLEMDIYDPKSLSGKTILNKIAKEFKVICNNCQKKNQLYKTDFYTLITQDSILCKHCLVDLFYESKSLKSIINGFIKQ